MEIIPLLIFGYIAFQIFKGFTKVSSDSSTDSAKSMMQNLHAQIERANTTQKPPRNLMQLTPTQRGRESLARKEASSPWGENGSVSPGAKVAANALEQSKAARKLAQKSPEQHGRRGRNIDQNRNRTDGWGQRGDSGALNGTTLIILLVIGGGILYALSKLPAG